MEYKDIDELEALFLSSDKEDTTFIAKKEKLNDGGAIRKNSQKSFLEELSDLDKNITTLMTNHANAKFPKIELKSKDSVVHNGDTDSSDDEDKQNCMEQKYNDYGKNIKQFLKKQEDEQKRVQLDKIFNNDTKDRNVTLKPPDVKYELKVSSISRDLNIKHDVYTDPIFGIRIINPQISSTTLIERMSGKISVSLAQIKKHTQSGALDSDWVVAGCIINKSPVKTSQKGTQYSIWSLSDLHNDLKTISLFLFQKAHKDLWKTNTGTVVGILNPSVLEKREGSKDEACLSIDNPQRIMIFGQSKDLGTCKSRKKNGDPCTAFVNTNKCEYCIFHVKQEYIQHSKRSELQSTFAGNGLQSLRNKVLGKNEVFYAGKSFTAIPSQKNRKQIAEDKNRLNLLSSRIAANNKSTLKQNVVNSLRTANKLNAARIEVTSSQREKDLERLKILKEYMPAQLNSSKNNTLANNLDNKSITKSNICDNDIFIPRLSADNGKVVNLNLNVSKSATRTNVNAKALEWVKRNGPIKKMDPSNLKGTALGKKRILEELNQMNQVSKKPKLEEQSLTFKSDRFKKIMEACSLNEHLIDAAENQKQEKYFEMLERKEAMEEKMLNTFKVACKAVSCAVCKYTSFSASQKCKTEKHRLTVTDGFKRFFKCQDCSNRTVTLDKIPKYSCKNCQGSHWIRTAMMKEKVVKITSEILSIRGDEETFIGSMMTEGNINLLVPE